MTKWNESKSWADGRVGCGSGSGVGYLCTYVCMYNKYNKPYNAYIYVMDVWWPRNWFIIIEIYSNFPAQPPPKNIPMQNRKKFFPT